MEKPPVLLYPCKRFRLLALAVIFVLLMACSLFERGASPTAVPAPQIQAATQPAAVPTSPPPPATVPPAQPTAPPPAEFTPATANPVKPDDVLYQAGYLLAATGFGGWRCNEPSEQLYDLYAQIQGRRVLDPGIPTVFYICGWKDGEAASVFIRYPSGVTLTTPLEPAIEDITPGVYFAEYRFTLAPDDPPGEYAFIFKGAGREKSVPAVYAPLTRPVLRIVGDDELYLAGFQPGERVRLFAYQTTPGQGLQGAELPLSTFLAWQEFTLDGSGFLRVPTTFDAMLFAALGTESGEALAVRKELPVAVSSIRWDSCEYSLWMGETQLQTGGQAVIAGSEFSTGSGLYDSPAGNLITHVPPGTVVTLAFGPRCAAGYRWWGVNVDGTPGWLKETGYYYHQYLEKHE